MTWARDRIVAALDTVAGLQAMPSKPDVATAGMAWPNWVESRYTFGKLTKPLVHTYDVLATLSAGYDPETVEAADGLVPALMDALRKVAQVEVAEPVSITFNTPDAMPGVRVRCTPQPERQATHANR